MCRPNLTVINGSARSPSRLDWATVEQAITLSGSEDEARTLKFQRLVLSQLLGILSSAADQYVTDVGDDCGIDCFLTDYTYTKIHLTPTNTIKAYHKTNNNFPASHAP